MIRCAWRNNGVPIRFDYAHFDRQCFERDLRQHEEGAAGSRGVFDNDLWRDFPSPDAPRQTERQAAHVEASTETLEEPEEMIYEALKSMEHYGNEEWRFHFGEADLEDEMEARSADFSRRFGTGHGETYCETLCCSEPV